MPYFNLYKQLIDTEIRVPKSRLKPRNIYKIVTYKYADGVQKTMTGTETTLIFLIGITTDKKLNCLKISEIRPAIFFKWLPTIVKPSITSEDIDNLTRLNLIIKKSDVTGRTLFNSSVKGKPIYKRKEHIYRTYNLSGINQIVEVRLKPDELKKQLL